MKPRRRAPLAALLLAFLLPSQAAEKWPKALPVQTLGGVAVRIPDDLAAGACLLIVGFSKASRQHTSAWSRALAADADPQGRVETYQVIVLEDVPSLFRGAIVRGIRSDVPASLQDRFLVVTEQADAWRGIVSYASPDEAYLVLLDPSRRSVWQSRGGPTAPARAALREAVHALRAAAL